MSSIQVGVRVRPFNAREIKYNSQLIVRMRSDRRTTELSVVKSHKVAANEKPRVFTYDFSFNTHDPNDVENYASQSDVYVAMGRPMLDNAVEGFNSCLFAYGQTGSGKTYTMMGIPSDGGVIPRLCQELFERAESMAGTHQMRIECSYLEIYNENVKDLLNPATDKYLRVRQHPKLGVFVEGLTKLSVNNVDEIQQLLTDGAKVRAVGCTNMNAVSSRSHAILSLNIRTRSKDHEVASRLHLVDLAGSERLAATGATGDTMMEGANINQSLTTLGMCLARLAEQGDGSKQHIPYRDSQLTWILHDSLGGNSKTAMLANVSPAHINYEETLTTLRYASTTKKIKVHAVVNEDPNQRIIRELREEIEQIKQQIKMFEDVASAAPLTSRTASKNEEVRNKLMEELVFNTQLMEEAVEDDDESRERKQQLIKERRNKAMKALNTKSAAVFIDASVPRLVTLNEDLHALPHVALLSYLVEGDNVVGSSLPSGTTTSTADSDDVRVYVPATPVYRVLPHHAILRCDALRQRMSVRLHPEMKAQYTAVTAPSGTARMSAGEEAPAQQQQEQEQEQEQKQEDTFFSGIESTPPATPVDHTLTPPPAATGTPPPSSGSAPSSTPTTPTAARTTTGPVVDGRGQQQQRQPAHVYVNGVPIGPESETRLQHLDRVIIGVIAFRVSLPLPWQQTELETMANMSFISPFASPQSSKHFQASSSDAKKQKNKSASREKAAAQEEDGDDRNPFVTAGEEKEEEEQDSVRLMRSRSIRMMRELLHEEGAAAGDEEAKDQADEGKATRDRTHEGAGEEDEKEERPDEDEALEKLHGIPAHGFSAQDEEEEFSTVPESLPHLSLLEQHYRLRLEHSEMQQRSVLWFSLADALTRSHQATSEAQSTDATVAAPVMANLSHEQKDAILESLQELMSCIGQSETNLVAAFPFDASSVTCRNAKLPATQGNATTAASHVDPTAPTSSSSLTNSKQQQLRQQQHQVDLSGGRAESGLVQDYAFAMGEKKDFWGKLEAQRRVEHDKKITELQHETEEKNAEIAKLQQVLKAKESRRRSTTLIDAKRRVSGLGEGSTAGAHSSSSSVAGAGGTSPSLTPRTASGGSGSGALSTPTTGSKLSAAAANKRQLAQEIQKYEDLCFKLQQWKPSGPDDPVDAQEYDFATQNPSLAAVEALGGTEAIIFVTEAQRRVKGKLWGYKFAPVSIVVRRRFMYMFELPSQKKQHQQQPDKNSPCVGFCYLLGCQVLVLDKPVDNTNAHCIRIIPCVPRKACRTAAAAAHKGSEDHYVTLSFESADLQSGFVRLTEALALPPPPEHVAQYLKGKK